MDWTEFGLAIANGLLPIAASLLVAVLSVFVGAAIQWLHTKTGIEVSDDQRWALESFISEGVGYAEEQGRKAIKAGDPTPEADTKLEIAVGYVIDRIAESGLPTMGEDAIVKLIEAKLGGNRKPGEE
jgi:hypothetical protein